MTEKVSVDIVIPFYKDVDEIVSLIESFKLQKNININRIVLPITLSNDESDNKIHEYCKSNNIIYFDLTSQEFSHSLTREKAIREYCESSTVVLLSQDVKLNKEDSLYQLAKGVASKEFAYTFGRQICPKNSLEKFIRSRNYPEQSKVVSKEDIDQLQIMAFFSSDAFACLDRDTFIKLNGYNGYDVMMNEDVLYSYFLLQAGYKKKYVAEAEVIHFHRLTLKQLYNRYYDTGSFFRKVKLFDQYESLDSGKKLAKYTLGQCFKHFYIPGLFRWFPDMLARYLGLKDGKKGKKEGKKQ